MPIQAIADSKLVQVCMQAPPSDRMSDRAGHHVVLVGTWIVRRPPHPCFAWRTGCGFLVDYWVSLTPSPL